MVEFYLFLPSPLLPDRESPQYPSAPTRLSAPPLPRKKQETEKLISHVQHTTRMRYRQASLDSTT